MLSGKDLSFTVFAGLVLLLSISSGAANADRVKDLTKIDGVRSNQLIGYGLVVGLNGTGDGSGEVTTQRVNDFLTQELLSAAQPSSLEGQGWDVTMTEVLGAAARRAHDGGRPGAIPGAVDEAPAGALPRL